METNTPINPPTPSKPNMPLLITVVASMLFGGLAGGIVTVGVLETRGGGTVTGTTKQNITVQENSATIDVVSKANPAVVSIIVTKDYSAIYGRGSSPFDIFGFPFSQSPQSGQQEVGGGSGFIVTSDGLIVTNKHVVDDEQASYSVVMNDGKKYDAKVVAKDPSNDVAVVRIEAKNLPTLEFANSDGVQIGQSVIAIGNALGEYRNTVTEGIISGKARTITASDSASGSSETLEGVFQTDAAINSGNSGGPLLDLSGRVIAINTAVSSSGQLIGFAIPSNVVQRDLESVQKTGTITRPFLGVRYVMITKALADKEKLSVDHGALIQAVDRSTPGVVSGSPAEKAGLKEGDVLLTVNGVAIDDTHSLTGLLNNYNPGDEVTITFDRDGTTKTVKVTLDTKK